MRPIRIYAQWLGGLAMSALLAAPGLSEATTVRMQTSKGNIDIQLYDADAPLTVTNFLNYVNSGAYANSFLHRSIKNFVVQGGGFMFDTTASVVKAIPTNAPVKNEFSKTRSNIRGTIAMAKLGGDPNSATNQWFFNLADNSGNLDNQNGGFTVFGQVTTDGMKVVDAIAALQVVDASKATNAGGASIAGNFSTLPVNSALSNNTIQQSNLVSLSAVFVLDSKVECLLNWAERQYPTLFTPTGVATLLWGGEYLYRYYPATKIYLGVSNKDSHVYFLPPGSGLIDEGLLSQWLPVAGCNLKA